MFIQKISSPAYKAGRQNFIQNSTLKQKNVNFNGAFWDSAEATARKAGDRLGLDERLLNQIITPDRELASTVFVPGRAKGIPIWRVQHDGARGPYKGGIRMTPNVDLDTVKALSMDMTWKTALFGLPLGGGKGGIQVDPAELTDEQMEALFRGFGTKFEKYLGSRLDIPAPDIGTRNKHMDILMDQLSKLKGYDDPGAVTGKSLTNGGSKGRTAATGLGVVFTIEEACKEKGIDLKNASCAVQGSGNVGGTAAKFLYDRGVKVKAMSDIYGAIRNPKGIDVPAALEHIKKTGSLKGFPGAEEISNAELLAADVDILVPAATQGQIHAGNAESIRAKIIAEGANGPTTHEADPILNKKGIHIIPDILANGGGVGTSHDEYIQNITRDTWDEATVLKRLENRMRGTYKDVSDFAREHKIPMRDASALLSLSRVAEAHKARGKN